MNDILKTGLFAATAGALWKAVGVAKDALEGAVTIKVTAEDAEPLMWLGEWLAHRSGDRNRLTVHEHDAPVDGRLASRAMFMLGGGTHMLEWEGRPVWVTRERERVSMTNVQIMQEKIVIRMLGNDPAPLRRLVLEAEAAYRERRAEGVTVRVPNRWGEWVSGDEVPERRMNSLSLPEGVGERILRDVRQFLGARDWYVSAGIPWRRGYLLHGHPGCGKTSLARVLASECALDMYVVSLAKSDNAALADMMARVRSRSLVLLEDVEEVVDDAGAGVTRSGLLNVIDGAAASEGRVLVMTTNAELDTLDPALIRPGRADMTIRLGPLDEQGAAAMFERFFPGHPARKAFGRKAAGMTPATAQGVLLKARNAGDPGDAVALI